MPPGVPVDCVDVTTWKRFLAEELDEAEEAGLQEHVGTCSTCQLRLEEVAGTPGVWSGLRESLGQEEVPDVGEALPVPLELDELVELLDPTDDPQMLGRLGGYEICGLIGRGATGLVMKALEPRLHRYVAIKLLSPVYSASGSARQRFEREGRAIAAVSNEHVVPIYAVDDHRGLPYIVMKYIPGLSLEQRIERDGPLDTCEVVRVGLQVARGLAAAHEQGIVHRDVKPANVILEDTVERAMIGDFGLARVADEASMTRSGTISGTPQFMSPEQARGEPIDRRSDLFSLGSLLYAACTGRAPFRAENVYGVIHRVCETRPWPIRELHPAIDEWLVAFVGKLMEKRPEDRFQSANEVAELLSEELAHLQSPTTSERPSRPWMERAKPSVRKFRRRPLVRAAGAASLVGLAGFGVWLCGDSEEARGLRASILPQFATGKEVAVPVGRVRDGNVPGVTWIAQENDEGTVVGFEQELVRTFPVDGPGTFVARLGAGDIEVVPGDPGQVQVTVRRRLSAAFQGAAEQQLSSHDLEFLLQEGDLSLTADAGEGAKLESAHYRVAVPAGFAPDLRTEHGSISVGPIQSDLKARTDYGHVQLAHIGGALWARSTGGDICAPSGCEGAADLFAVGGDVRLGNAQGSARVRASDGDVYLTSSTGAVTAQTSGGDVYVNEVAGSVAAYTSVGSVYVQISETPIEAGEFRAAGGNVEVYVAEDVAATIVAQGNLDSLLPFELNTAREGRGESWSGYLNGGGAQLSLVSATGQLTVAHLDEAPDFGSGSGLGGSGSGDHASEIELSEVAHERTTGEPRAGALATVMLPEVMGAMDGYTLYLPISHDQNEDLYPVIVYLQGAYGVGGRFEDINNWGLVRLLRDEEDLSLERNQLLLDGFIVVTPHILGGQYHDQPEAIASVLTEIVEEYRGDPTRISVTGLSRGGHGSWGLASRLPGTFAAIAPIGGDAEGVSSFDELTGLSIWIGHNAFDGVVPFSGARDAARAMEQATGEEFLRLNPGALSESDYLEHRFVFTSSPSDGHDAWTDLYTSPEFYRWLQKQRRPVVAQPVGYER